MAAAEQPGAPWMERERQAALGAWLRATLGRSAEITLTPLSGGTSGSVLKIDSASGPIVLRTTSWPPRADSRKAIEREARLLKALDSTAVPHPAFIAWCDDERIIGVPFSLIGFIDGWLGVDSMPPAYAADPRLHHQAAFAMIEAIAELPKVDVDAIGLSDFGRPDGFLERQVGRWTALMDKHRADPAYGDRVIPHWDEVAAWLADNRPEMQRISLIHGDVSFSNVMLARDAPPRVEAIIDWELATLGDPLLDLGRVAYPFTSRDGTPGASLAIDLAGYPSREALVDHYGACTGLSVRHAAYYMVLAMFKLAALIEFNYVKSKSQPPGSMAHRIADFIPDLVSKAYGISRGRMS
jgi:aminoglycoside phosphotransferase (APT) family kinase protein